MMTDEVRQFVAEESKKLEGISWAYSGVKKAAAAWLKAAGTADEEAATAAYVKELKADILPIDDLIAFAGSEDGKKVFGEKGAADTLLHAKEIKGKGARYCDCGACAACAAILEKLQ